MPGRLPQKVGLRQLRGSRLQYRTSPYIDGGVEVSVHKPHALMASDGTLQRKDCQNSSPLCQCILVVVPSDKRLISPIPSLLLRLRHWLVLARWSGRRRFLAFFRQPAMVAL
jgi:hypothetical protein